MVNLINLPVSRQRMEHYQNKHGRQIEHAARQVELRDAKVKSTMLRKDWLERQTNSNYRNEYDRIRGELSHPKLGAYSIRQFKEREAYLSRLFSSGNL